MLVAVDFFNGKKFFINKWKKSLEGCDHDKPKGFTNIVDMEELSQPPVLGKLGFKEKRRKVRID